MTFAYDDIRDNATPQYHSVLSVSVVSASLIASALTLMSVVA